MKYVPLPLPHQELAFGPFTLCRASRQLRANGQPVHLGSHALGLLDTLATRAGEVVGKRELIAAAWPRGSAEEATLRAHLSALRRALGDGRDGSRYIANVAGRGYCFVAPVASNAAIAPPATPPQRPALPLRLTRMIGREALIEELGAVLARQRLLTLGGAAGMGKTRVALALAARLAPGFADGVAFVDVGALGSAAALPAALAESLGLAPAADAEEALLAFVRPRRLLLLLDGCEHLRAPVASLAERLLAQAPGLRLLLSSREPLRCAAEVLRQVPALTPPQAVQLFVERARASVSDFQLDELEAPAALELCRQLDGMPLAIELAAARVDAFDVQGLLQRLDDRFQLLGQGQRDVLPRHRSLRAALDWSHDALPPAEQRVLRRLAVFDGPFHAACARRLLRDARLGPAQIDAALRALAAKSLLQTETDERLRLLDSTRAYALEKLVASGELAALQRRHARLPVARRRHDG